MGMDAPTTESHIVTKVELDVSKLQTPHALLCAQGGGGYMHVSKLQTPHALLCAQGGGGYMHFSKLWAAGWVCKS